MRSPSPKPMNIVLQPSQNDILCGKDKYCLRHEGSRRFKRLVGSYQLQYQQLESKRDKMILTKTIFDAIKKTSARFLKFNSQLSCWEEINQINARDKISHALRHLKPNTRRKRKYTSGVPDFVGMTDAMKLDNDLYGSWGSKVNTEPLESLSSTSTMIHGSPSLQCHNKTEDSPQFALLDTVSLAYIRNREGQAGPKTSSGGLNGIEESNGGLDFPTFDNKHPSLFLPRGSYQLPCLDPLFSNGNSVDTRNVEASNMREKAIQRERPTDYKTTSLNFPTLGKQWIQIDSSCTNTHKSPTRGSEDNALSRLLDSWITNSMHSSHLS